MRREGVASLFGLLAFLLLFVPFGLSNCAVNRMSALERDIQSHVEQCTRTHGYDPEALQGVGERELGLNEKEWRECVYEGIRTLIVPRSAVPQMYAEFIERDRKMTEDIEKGLITRSDRKKRNEELAALIKKQEETHAERAKSTHETNATIRKKVEFDMKRDFLEGPPEGVMRALTY